MDPPREATALVPTPKSTPQASSSCVAKSVSLGQSHTSLKRSFRDIEDNHTEADSTQKRIKLQEVRGKELRTALDSLKAKRDDLFSSHELFMTFARHLMATPLDVMVYLALQDQPTQDIRAWVDDCVAAMP